MDLIYHEQQFGQLCAQHCLNSLLQGPHFDAVALAEIGRRLDAAEQQLYAREFAHQRSENANYDDSGFFSIEVIRAALASFDLTLIPYKNHHLEESNVNAVILNLDRHWYCVRRIGKQWFDLNSMHVAPKFISDTYLSVCIATMMDQKGYTAFSVVGRLPESAADDVLKLSPVTRENAEAFFREKRAEVIRLKNGHNSQDSDAVDYESQQLKLAIEESLKETRTRTKSDGQSIDKAPRLRLFSDQDGGRTLGSAPMSANRSSTVTQNDATSVADRELARQRRLERFKQMNNTQ